MALSVAKIRIAQLLVAAPGFVLLSIAFHGAVTDFRLMREAKQRQEARTEVAEATVIGMHNRTLRSGARTPEGTVVFTAASGQEVRFPYADPLARVGQKLQVRYNPEHPEDFVVGDRIFDLSDLIWDNVFFVVFGLYLLLMAVVIGRRGIARARSS